MVRFNPDIVDSPMIGLEPIEKNDTYEELKAEVSKLKEENRLLREKLNKYMGGKK